MGAGLEPIILRVSDQSMVGEARRAATLLSVRLGFNDTDQGRAAVISTELAKNLVEHARGGLLVTQPLPTGPGLELLAVDSGPGMADPGRCLVDGYSTAGTAGIGLGGVSRLSDLFDLHSLVGAGTVVLSRLVPGRAVGAGSPTFEVGGLSVPKHVGAPCGDAWTVLLADGQARLLVADGLGHGPEAAEASGEAVRVFRSMPGAAPLDAMEALNRALLKTRGAAVAAAEIDAARGTLRFVGVGNIAGAIMAGPDLRNAVSHNGIVGHSVRKLQQFEYGFPPAALAVFYSDGVHSRWDLSRYPGLTARHPSIIASVMHRDFRRDRDDATVVVLRRGV